MKRFASILNIESLHAACYAFFLKNEIKNRPTRLNISKESMRLVFQRISELAVEPAKP
jgi:hypothetical protein